MEQEIVLNKTAEYINMLQQGEGSGHDWWHTYRVRKLAKTIAKEEELHNHVDQYVVELASLLHDIADYKLTGDESTGPRMAREWLSGFRVQEENIGHVCEIIQTLDFKGAGTMTVMATIEGKVVHDADKLDAIGAIGIARAFAYGGFTHQPIYEPDIKPELHETFEEYKTRRTTTINHFYEKLLLLKDRMLTGTGKRMAEERHMYIIEFLQRFNDEWDGRK